MSKKLIQTKLSFSSSQPNLVSDEVTKPCMKRKLSDSTAEEYIGESGNKKVMSYANAVKSSSNHGNSPGHERKSSSHQDKTKERFHGKHKKRPTHDVGEGSSRPSHTFSSTGKHEFRRQHSANSATSSNNEGNAGPPTIYKRSVSETENDSLPFRRRHREQKSDSSDTEDGNVSMKNEKPQTLSDGNHISRGIPIRQLNRAPECFRKKDITLPVLRASADHKVFFKVQDGEWNGEQLKPFPASHHDTWNDDHVYMPNDRKNEVSENGRIHSRWEKILMALTATIPGSFELEDAIISYNPHYKNRWNFEALHRYFEESADGINIKETFFTEILPKMQKLAIQLPELCPKAIPILKQRRDMKITLSQQQVACLLANAFFCTFPKRNFKSKYSHLPDINFSNMYSDSHASRKSQKFSCIINYFQQVTKNMPTGTVTYARQFIQMESSFWNKMDKKFTNLHVSTSGTIEDDGRGMLQADFANKYVGGGVLGHGLVQEEIRFLICPEMILSRLFTEVLTDNEVLIMTGCERFSNYEGYSDSFKFSGNHEDNTERDEWGRRYTEVVAMDALVIRYGYISQFEKEKVFRELNKAYCAFKSSRSSVLPAVCTGNWGCGAFGGDKQLKALVQLMAASAANRDVCYFTFGDDKLCNQLGRFYDILKENELSISSVLELIKSYNDLLNSGRRVKTSLFKYIGGMLGANDEIFQDTSKPNIVEDFPSDFINIDIEEDYKANTP